jgi:ABC-type uncharacterized transport system involved in gliding motility auxiliary subunit
MAGKKKSPWSRYAIIALIVTLLATIAVVLIALVKGAASLQLYTPPDPNILNRGLYIGIAVIVLGLATYAMMEPGNVRRFFTGRQARYGSNTLIMTLAFAGIIFVANYIVYQNPKSWDLTEDKSHTLAPETLQALATLPNPVKAVAFFAAPSNTAEQLLKDFKTNSNGKFDYQFVNPDLNPIAARQAGITGDGKIMLVMGDHKEIASYASETELTRSLIRLISPGERIVYFLTGHGEPDTVGGGAADSSLSIARSTLESKNYTVKSLNLLASNQIPQDAMAIIIAGPKKPLTDQEVSVLSKYMTDGGSLVVMEDPVVFTDFGDQPDPLAAYLAKDWGITLNNDVIIDITSQNPLWAISATANAHPITQNLSANYAVILRQARSLSLSERKGVTQTALLQTSDQSWGETNYVNSAGSQLSYDASVDTRGPLNMAVAAENSDAKSRIVAFGNSLFATDSDFDAYGNGNIFVNSVDWAAEQENLINITPRTLITRSFIPPSSLQLLLIMIGSIFIIPGLVLVAGISSWLSRRRRG